MSVHTKKHITLMSEERNIIVDGEWLTDVHMEHFQNLLQNCSEYTPVETWRVQFLDTIQPVPTDKKHIQILHSSSSPSDGHWVCSYYDKKNIFIYDSLNNKTLHKHHEQFLKRLFPTYDFDKNPVKFPTVQRQPNYSDCGVFAIAFATSLLFNIKPDKVKYEHKLMRSHLIKILETNIIEHFPQNPQYVAQKVLPLAVIKVREAEAIRKRMIRQSETDQQKSNRLKKYRDNYSRKKEFNKTQLTLQSATKEIQLSQQNDLNKIQLIQSGSQKIMEELISIKIEYNNKSECLQNKNQQLYQEKIFCVTKCRRYHQDLENNCAKQKLRYNRNLENNRAKKIQRYKKDLDNNRAKQKLRYKTNLENNRAKKIQRYKKDLDNNRAKQMQRYKKNLDNNRAKQMQRYKKDLDNNRAKQMQLYQKNLDNNRARKRRLYEQDFDNNRAKKRRRYEQDVENNRIKKRKRYLKNFQYEQKVMTDRR